MTETELVALEARLEKLGLELLETEDRLTSTATDARETLTDIRVTLKTVKQERRMLENVLSEMQRITKETIQREARDVLTPLYDRTLEDVKKLRREITATFAHWKNKMQEFQSVLQAETERRVKQNRLAERGILDPDDPALKDA